MSSIGDDALDRYLSAQERVDQAQSEWEAAGSPLLKRYPNGTVGPDPTLKVLVAAEKHAASLQRMLPRGPRRIGRPVGAQSAPDRIRRNGDAA